MSYWPEGYSSDEDDLGRFSWHGEIKSIKEELDESNNEVCKAVRQFCKTSVYRLYVALVDGSLEDVAKELDHGVDVNAILNDGKTPLCLAASLGDAHIVESLLKHGAAVNTYSCGFTPLLYACKSTENSCTPEKILSIVKQLIENGANPKLFDQKRTTALMYAANQGYAEVVDYLIPISNLDAEDQYGRTALNYAVWANKPAVVKSLLYAGANVEHNDGRNKNVKYYAKLKDLDMILNIIQEYDKNVDELFLEDVRPNFYKDVKTILDEIKCDKIMSVFQRHPMNLYDFLRLNLDSVKKNPELNYVQRKKILQKIHQIYLDLNKSEYESVVLQKHFTFNLYSSIATSVKQLIIMEAAVKYLKQNYKANDNNTKQNYLKLKISQTLGKVDKLIERTQIIHNFEQMTKESAVSSKWNRDYVNVIVISAIFLCSSFCTLRAIN